jgi:hypothetical protein
MIRPWKTSLFGYYKDKSYEEMNDLEEEEVNEKLGLGELHR